MGTRITLQQHLPLRWGRRNRKWPRGSPLSCSELRLAGQEELEKVKSTLLLIIHTVESATKCNGCIHNRQWPGRCTSAQNELPWNLKMYVIMVNPKNVCNNHWYYWLGCVDSASQPTPGRNILLKWKAVQVWRVHMYREETKRKLGRSHFWEKDNSWIRTRGYSITQRALLKACYQNPPRKLSKSNARPETTQ